MADFDMAFLMQQQELLREIRDELRSSRAGAGAAQTGTGGAAIPGASPGATFAHFQAAADKTMLGEWSTLGWSNAYSSTYRSSYASDLMAVMGIGRAPENMSQAEYEVFSRQSLGYRTANLMGSMVAPEYTDFTDNLTGSIYRNSQRFIRPGSPLANAFGSSGMNFNAAAQLTSKVGQLALNDSRLSMRDYGQIVDAGMRMNQFNDVSTGDEFVQRTKELAAATASLTRTLHMSVSEIAQSMGNLRTIGIQGVGQQASMMRQIGGFGAVAGMSADEMMRFSYGFAETQLGNGVDAGANMQLAAINAATIRTASAQGLLSGNLVAQGGGALQMAQNISSAQMRFAASTQGYLAMRGGGAGANANTFNAMFTGIGGYHSVSDLMSMNMDRFDAAGSISGEGAADLFRNQVFTGFRTLGIDPMSRQAQGLAFQQLQSQYGMDAASSRAWILSNQTVAGRRASDNAQVSALRMEEAARQRDQQDQYFSRFSLAGRIHAGVQAFGRIGAGLLDYGRDAAMNYGAEGTDFQLGHMSSYAAAAGAQSLNLTDRANALAHLNLGADDTTARVLGNRSADEIAGGAYMLSTTAGGMSALAGGLGFLTTGLAGSLGSAGLFAAGGLMTVAAPWLLAGAAIAGGTALAVSAFAGGATTRVTDRNTIRNLDTATSVSRRANAARGLQRLQQLSAGGGLHGSAWQKLRDLPANATDGTDAVNFANLMDSVVRDNSGVSAQDVMDVKTALSGTVNFADSFKIGDNTMYASKAGQEAIKDLLGEGMLGGIFNSNKRVATTNLMASSGEMQQYIDSVISGHGTASDLDSAMLRKSLGDDAYEAFSANVKRNYANGNTTSLKLASAGLGSTRAAVAAETMTADEESVKRFILDRVAGSGLSAADRNRVSTAFESSKHGEIFRTIEGDSRLRDLATSGAFGETTKQALSVASNAELAKMSAMDIEKKYGLTVSAEDWKKAVAAQGGQGGSLREAVQESLFGSVGAKKEEAAGETEAALLHRTAQILGEIETGMHRTAVTNGK